MMGSSISTHGIRVDPDLRPVLPDGGLLISTHGIRVDPDGWSHDHLGVHAISTHGIRVDPDPFGGVACIGSMKFQPTGSVWIPTSIAAQLL